MIQTENNTDSIEKIVAILYQVSEHLQGFTREFAEIPGIREKSRREHSPVIT